MREMFRYADKNGDGSLTLREVVQLLKHLNIEVDGDQAKQIFDVSAQILSVVHIQFSFNRAALKF